MSKLITATLIGSIDWLRTCPQDWCQSARKDLVRALARDYSEPPGKAMLLGQRFEAQVYKSTAKPREEVTGSEHFKKVVEECRGGVFQRKAKKIIELDDGEEYCLYGKIDVWFQDILKDIKTTSNWKGRAYYLSSFQHILYCFAERKNRFRYVVVEFDEAEKVVDTHFVDYVGPTDTSELRPTVEATIKDAIGFLQSDEELWTLYNTKFSRY